VTLNDLSSLKVGDFVHLLTPAGGGVHTKEQVERITKTQIILSRHKRFMRATGRAYGWGDSFLCPFIEPWDDAAEEVVLESDERLEKLHYVHFLAHYDYSSLPLEDLKRLYHCLPECTLEE